jgi:hypothetical protein
VKVSPSQRVCGGVFCFRRGFGEPARCRQGTKIRSRGVNCGPHIWIAAKSVQKLGNSFADKMLCKAPHCALTRLSRVHDSASAGPWRQSGAEVGRTYGDIRGVFGGSARHGRRRSTGASLRRIGYYHRLPPPSVAFRRLAKWRGQPNGRTSVRLSSPFLGFPRLCKWRQKERTTDGTRGMERDMPHLRCLGSSFGRLLQICRTYGAGEKANRKGGPKSAVVRLCSALLGVARLSAGWPKCALVAVQPPFPAFYRLFVGRLFAKPSNPTQSGRPAAVKSTMAGERTAALQDAGARILRVCGIRRLAGTAGTANIEQPTTNIQHRTSNRIRKGKHAARKAYNYLRFIDDERAHY